MTDKLNDFIEHMRASGIGPANPTEIVADDKRKRYQVEGDRNRSQNGEYCLRIDADGFAVGWYKSYKHHPDAISWSSKSKKRMSAEDKAEHARRLEADRVRRQAEDAAMRDHARREIARMWEEAVTAESHPYLTKKGLTGVSAKVWFDSHRMEDAVLVPAYKAGDMVGMQKIYQDGAKMFVPSSDLDGSWFAIGGDIHASEHVAICEGYATGQTIHQATGWPVAVAFNAGNMVKVAKAVAAVHTGVVICSDEDLYTWGRDRTQMPAELPPHDAPEWVQWREAGLLVNTGREAGMKAAAAIGGAQVLYPVGGGDWNDAAARDGLDSVREHLLGAVAKKVDNVPEWEPEYHEIGPSYDDVAHPSDLLAELTGPLGYDKETYYFLPKTKGQIIELSASGLASVNNLYQLGSVSEYQRVMQDPQLKASDLTSTVGPMLIDMCHRKGIYEPEKVYGAGAWRVGGRVYVNTGRDVYDVKEGVFRPHSETKIDGVFVKEARAYDLDCAPLGNADAHKLVQICQALKWKRPISGTLLAGWLVIAPVGGALRWRPHVFITGPKGAGKSTVMDAVVVPVLPSAISQDGGSTEAGLRRQVGDSSRPFKMDEFEGELVRDKENVQKIFTWTRKASSGGMIVNANGTYRARSCVSFAAINPMIIQGADADRITILELAVNKDADSEQQYNRLMDMIHDTITPEYANSLVRRTVDNIEALLANCEVFAKHASRILGSKRAGDQVGPMLAGAYMLHATGIVTDEKAEEYCARQDWSWIDEQQEGTDSERLVRKIMNSMVEYSTMDRTVRMPVSEMIMRVYQKANGYEDAAKALTRVGMVVKDEWLCVANSDDGLSTLLKETPWQVYRPGLSRYEGCVSDGKTMRFGGGSPRRFMKLPLEGLIDMGMQVEEVQW